MMPSSDATWVPTKQTPRHRRSREVYSADLNFKRDTGRRGERTVLMTIMGRNDWEDPYSLSLAISFTSMSFSTSTVRSSSGSDRIFCGLLQK
ncbi:hypothetical protein EVAR_95527_1 [Eumeta japonica]|uniref:Uncharacterized protein n=1 Tax=Eumeta variegata TaxID=151549 RepID=A0A4C1UKD5_EUMVA|nr:hypothetical protein EVAR_95527_1 [Eumeta japonica]